MALLTVLWHYARAKRLHFATRADLTAHQTQKWRQFQSRVLTKSRYFSRFAKCDLSAVPLMNKAVMLQHFDDMNTAGLTLQDAFDVAQRAERERDFVPTLGGYSVGLSSGTSASRGVFVVSRAEQSRWAGTILAKLLPNGLFSGERVALVLRANNNLYQSVDNRFIAFRFFDLLQPFDDIAADLQKFRPSIIVAPAQVLLALARAVQNGDLVLPAKRVISAAEVLNERDADIIRQSFPDLHQVYQATEGFLAATCAHGRLHLNEENLIVEQEWLDDNRYVPVITDFCRTTQPIVRYRLDDVLHHDDEPCPCGSVCRVIKRIEGRLNDVLRLPRLVQNGVQNGESAESVELFADALERIMAQNLPINADYQLTQTAANRLHLQAETDDAGLHVLQGALCTYFAKQMVDVARLVWQCNTHITPQAMNIKRRRICVNFAD